MTASGKFNQPKQTVAGGQENIAGDKIIISPVGVERVVVRCPLCGRKRLETETSDDRHRWAAEAV